MIKAGLIGITGYTGMELIRILASHPQIELVYASSRAEHGKTISELYPFFKGLQGGELKISMPDAAVAASLCDLVFLAVPHSKAMVYASSLYEKNIRVIDLSADFRIHDFQIYEQWYDVKHSCKELLDKAVYGLPELYAKDISKARLVANPGCYPSSVILGLYPALKNNLIKPENIVIDSKSGTTGAGRKAAVATLFCEVHDSFRAYGLGKHRHTPEIEQELSLIAKQDIIVSFNTHLLPISRGILSTIYTNLQDADLSLDDVHAIYTDTWSDCPWVRVLPKNSLPETRYVRGTMFCDIGLAVDHRTNRLIIVVAIDNLCRGASGQAVANANLMFGLPLTEGLMFAPLMP